MRGLYTSWILALCAALVSVGAPTAVSASSAKTAPTKKDEKRALELFGQGREKFEAEDFEGAIESFEAAYELLDERNLLYNIAQAHARMGNYDKALDVLDRYRLRAPESEYEQIDQQAAEWTKELEAAQPESEPTDAAIHKLEPRPKPIEPDEPTPSKPIDPPPKTKIFGVGPGVLTAVAVAGLGSGLGLGLASDAAKQRAFDLCVDDNGTVRCQNGFEDRVDDNARLALGANIALAIGGAAAVATIIWVSVSASKRKKARAQATVAPLLDRDQAGLSFTGRF